MVAILVGLLVSSLRIAFQRGERAKLAAEAATRARDELVGVISHELRNPLTALQASVDLVQRASPKIPENEGTRRLIERLQPSIRRMTMLVSDLLDVTRIEAHVLALHPRECDIGELFAEINQTYEAPAKEKLIDLDFEAPRPEDRAVYCDPSRTGQIIANLVGNALKFTHEGGKVRISGRKVHDCFEVSVTDNGRGIPADCVDHVFDRFWQAKSGGNGVGLGLPIAKGLVEAQGGKIWVESALGEGSAFRFTLPSVRPVVKLVSA